jgi:hypothetical protein
VFPEATIQTCIVHLLRHSLDFVSYEDRKAVAAALKDIYRAIDAAAGEAALAAFDEGPWGRRYPAIGQSWRRTPRRSPDRRPCGRRMIRLLADHGAKWCRSTPSATSVEYTPPMP